MLVFAGAVLADSAPDWQAALDKYGLPVILVAALVVGGSRYLVPGWVHQRALADLDREREEHAATRAGMAELEGILRGDVVPALVRSTEAHERVVAILGRVEHRLDAAGTA